MPHNKKSAVNPQRKETPGLCGINAETMKAMIAMLHHGKYKQAKKLKSKIRSMDAINFIVEEIIFFLYQIGFCAFN